MPRWIKLFQKSLETSVTEDQQKRLQQGAESITDRTSPAKKAAWACEVMGRLENDMAEPERRRVLEGGGRLSISVNTLEKARQIRAGTPILEVFLDRLNLEHIGGGYLAWRDGGIDAGYARCYCGMVSQT